MRKPRRMTLVVHYFVVLIFVRRPAAERLDNGAKQHEEFVDFGANLPDARGAFEDFGDDRVSFTGAMVLHTCANTISLVHNVRSRIVCSHSVATVTTESEPGTRPTTCIYMSVCMCVRAYVCIYVCGVCNILWCDIMYCNAMLGYD